MLLPTNQRCHAAIGAPGSAYVVRSPASDIGKLVAQLGRPTLGGAQRPLLILSLVVFRTSIHVLLAIAQHGVDEPGQLVGRGGNGLGRTHLCLLPAQEGAQGAVGAVQRVGRQTQGRGGPVGAGLGL